MADILKITETGCPAGPGTLYTDEYNETFFIETEHNILVNLRTGKQTNIDGNFQRGISDLGLRIFFGEITISNG